MHITIRDRKLKANVTDDRKMSRAYGVPMSRKINLRLQALNAAENLAVFWPPYSPPERCHELKGDRKGSFSMDLVHPFRLIFEATGPEANSAPDEVLEGQPLWATLESVFVTSIEDTHG